MQASLLKAASGSQGLETPSSAGSGTASLVDHHPISWQEREEDGARAGLPARVRCTAGRQYGGHGTRGGAGPAGRGWRCPGPHASGERLGEAGHSLEHIAVELLLPVAQELADHLPAQALALQQEVGHPHWRVGHEAALDEVLDALLRLPGGQETGSAGRARPHRLHGTRSCPSLTPPPGAPGTVRAPRPAWASEGQAQSGPAQHTLTTRGQAGRPAPRGPPTPPPTAQAPDSCVASQSRDHP